MTFGQKLSLCTLVVMHWKISHSQSIGAIILGILLPRPPGTQALSSSSLLTDPNSSIHGRYQAFLETTNYSHRVLVGEAVAIHWTILNSTNEIHLGVTAAAGGWVGLGISQVGGMKGADLVVYEVATGQLGDYYSMDYVAPTRDACPSDWILVNSTSSVARQADEEGAFIFFQAIRLLDTEDTQDWAFLDDSRWDVQPTTVIVAWGEAEYMSFHGNNRASTSVRFFGNTTDSGSNLQYLQNRSDGSFFLTANNYTIPTAETTYYDFCVDFADIPNFPSTDQAIYLVGIAFANSSDVNGVNTYSHIHHFSAFGNTAACVGTDYQVQNIFYGWGPGQEPLILPDDVGIPLAGDSTFQSLALQIHYNNPDGFDSLVDSTGIQIFYVFDPPKHRAAAMVVGDGNIGLIGQSVGSGQKSYRFTCPSTCTSSHFEAPITIFAEALHQHQSGQRSINQIIRDQQVVHQASVDVWDYPHGGIKIVQQEPYELYPGDVFRTYCYYDNPSDATLFGLGTQDEMCQAIFWYYPASEASHGFCGYQLSSAFAPDTNCDAELLLSDAAQDFDRVFGSEPRAGCNASAEQVDSVAPTIFLLDPTAPASLVDGAPTASPTYYSGNPVCHVCGEGFNMTLPDEILNVPGGGRPCSQIRDAGLNGFIKESLCSTTQIVVSTGCGCSNSSDTSSPAATNPADAEESNNQSEIGGLKSSALLRFGRTVPLSVALSLILLAWA